MSELWFDLFSAPQQIQATIDFAFSEAIVVLRWSFKKAF